jgi:hypothetical protein
MPKPLQADVRPMRHGPLSGWAWWRSAGLDLVMLGAAVGLIAAIAVGAPQLQLY